VRATDRQVSASARQLPEPAAAPAPLSGRGFRAARLALGAVVLGTALAVGGAAASTPSASPAPSPGAAAKVIGVVALGADQFLRWDWFESEPGYRELIARGPTYTTLKPAELALKTRREGNAERLFRAFVESAGDADSAAPIVLLPLVPLAAVAYALESVGSVEVVRPQPVTAPLGEVSGAARGLLPELLDKRRLGEGLRERVRRLGGETTAHIFVALSFEEARDRRSLARPVDGVLALRVDAVGLVGESGDDPACFLHVQAWANLDRTNGFPVAYRGQRLPLGAWAADGARRFRAEVDRTLESLARGVVEGAFWDREAGTSE
jgi:hypothetical protein